MRTWSKCTRYDSCGWFLRQFENGVITDIKGCLLVLVAPGQASHTFSSFVIYTIKNNSSPKIQVFFLQVRNESGTMLLQKGSLGGTIFSSWYRFFKFRCGTFDIPDNFQKTYNMYSGYLAISSYTVYHSYESYSCGLMLFFLTNLSPASAVITLLLESLMESPSDCFHHLFQWFLSLHLLYIRNFLGAEEPYNRSATGCSPPALACGYNQAMNILGF